MADFASEGLAALDAAQDELMCVVMRVRKAFLSQQAPDPALVQRYLAACDAMDIVSGCLSGVPQHMAHEAIAC